MSRSDCTTDCRCDGALTIEIGGTSWEVPGCDLAGLLPGDFAMEIDATGSLCLRPDNEPGRRLGPYPPTRPVPAESVSWRDQPPRL